MEKLSEPAREALAEALHVDERIEMVAPAVGSELILTDRRFLVVREGARYRPTTGVRSFDLDDRLRVAMEHGRKRVIITATGKTITLFVRPDQVAAAEALLAEVRRRVYAG
jgi:hypothetical protein